jgi:hypothetical protein
MENEKVKEKNIILRVSKIQSNSIQFNPNKI